MSIVVYWLENGPQAESFADTELLIALKYCEALRKEGKQHVCISSELKDSVGRPGVNDVLPDNYDWKKRRQS